MYNIDGILNIFVILSVSFYLLSTIILFTDRRRIGTIFTVGGWTFNLAIILINWYIAGYPPFANMYHVLTFLSFSFFPLYLILIYKEKLDWVLPYFILIAVFPLIGVLFMESQVSWNRVPALQSIWFMPHIVSYLISYSLAAVAFIIGVISMFKNKVLNHHVNSMESQAIYQILRLAFPFMTFGLFSGALWADEAWGIYWSWDIKETWALITWTLYLAYFHSRYSSYFRNWSNAFQILAFIALLMTFLLVNLLPQLDSLHSYI